MSARAPRAIWNLWSSIKKQIPRARMSGIVGDVNHSFGYHLARRDLPSDDYSVVTGKDRLGRSDAASALDVKLPPDLMKVVTNRLIRAAKAGDPRLRALRELCGTSNGSVTHNYDLHTGHEGWGEWDDSHRWHVHLSFYREYADNAAALQGIADVMAGKGSAPAPAKPVAKPVAKPTDPSKIPTWPLKPGNYFGLITGPAQSHGGYYPSERRYIRMIQKRLQKLGYAPKAASWADGKYEKPTRDAVAKWQRHKYAKYTSRYGEVWADDWKRLFG